MSHSGTTRCICTLATSHHVSPLSDTVLVPLMPWAQIRKNWTVILVFVTVCIIEPCVILLSVHLRAKQVTSSQQRRSAEIRDEIWLFSLHSEHSQFNTMHLVCTQNLETRFKFGTDTGKLSFSALVRWRVPSCLSLLNSRFPPHYTCIRQWPLG